MSFRSLLAWVAGACVVVGAAACSDSGDGGDSAPCTTAQIDRFKELMIVDESVISDPRSQNATNGAWSFRRQFENIMPEGFDRSTFIRTWLENWATETQVNGFKLDLEPRGEEMNIRLMCPWLKSTPANQCNDDCSTCAARELDLAKAPFRLIAIVNRGDLRGRPDIISPAGEARFVFGMTYGPGDDPSSQPAALSLIMEYALPTSRTAHEWAEAWHHLGTHAAFDDAYKAELEELTNAFAGRGVSPDRKNGSALAQIRTNESAFNWIWQLRQFRLDSLGDLRLTPLNNTPGQALNGTPALASYITEHKDEILADKHVLPPSMLAGSSDQLLYRWTFPSVEEPLRLAFARGTCNGCHTGENPVIDTAFHVSPYRKGTEKLSQFLNNPKAPESDELAHRAKIMTAALCEKN